MMYTMNKSFHGNREVKGIVIKLNKIDSTDMHCKTQEIFKYINRSERREETVEVTYILCIQQSYNKHCQPLTLVQHKSFLNATILCNDHGATVITDVMIRILIYVKKSLAISTCISKHNNESI